MGEKKRLVEGRISAPELKKIKLTELAESMERCLDEVRKAQAAAPSQSADSVVATLNQAASQIEAIIKNGRTALARLADEVSGHFAYCRSFMVDHGVYRKARDPNPVNAILLMLPAWLLETFVAAALFVADGHMTLYEAGPYAAIFAGLGIVIGAVAGFYPARYLNYKAAAAKQDLDAVKVRSRAKVGLFVSFAVLGLHLFIAARVRALGTHEGIFTFTDIGLFETLNDGMSIILIIVGLIGAGIAYAEGYFGFSDPVPNFTRIKREAEEALYDDAEDISEDTIETIEDISEPLLEEAEAYLKEAKGYTVIRQADYARIDTLFTAHNNDLTTAIDDILQAHADDESEARFVLQDKFEPSAPPELSIFDEFKLPPLDSEIPRFDPLASDSSDAVRKAMTSLRGSVGSAIAEIRTAHAEFLANAPSPDVAPQYRGHNDA